MSAPKLTSSMSLIHFLPCSGWSGVLTAGVTGLLAESVDDVAEERESSPLGAGRGRVVGAVLRALTRVLGGLVGRLVLGGHRGRWDGRAVRGRRRLRGAGLVAGRCGGCGRRSGRGGLVLLLRLVEPVDPRNTGVSPALVHDGQALGVGLRGGHLADEASSLVVEELLLVVGELTLGGRRDGGPAEHIEHPLEGVLRVDVGVLLGHLELVADLVGHGLELLLERLVGLESSLVTLLLRAGDGVGRVVEQSHDGSFRDLNCCVQLWLTPGLLLFQPGGQPPRKEASLIHCSGIKRGNKPTTRIGLLPRLICGISLLYLLCNACYASNTRAQHGTHVLTYRLRLMRMATCRAMLYSIYSRHNVEIWTYELA